MTPIPQRPYRALRAFIGATIILVVLGLWAHAQLQGTTLGTLWDVVVLALVAAAGIAVFGRRTFEAAVEASQQLQGDGGDDSTSESTDSTTEE